MNFLFLLLIFVLQNQGSETRFREPSNFHQVNLSLVETIQCIFCTRNEGFFAQTHKSLTNSIHLYLSHATAGFICIESFENRLDYGWVSGFSSPSKCESGQAETRKQETGTKF